MARLVSSLVSGLLFGAGLVLSGMTLPSKVTGFLDFTGAWDPSLAFVMAGAIAVHLTLYRLIMRRSRPLFDSRFHLPTRKDLDRRLVGGAALFGVGWGLAGLCPGPALTTAATGSPWAVGFVLAMAVGMLLQGAVDARRQGREQP